MNKQLKDKDKSKQGWKQNPEAVKRDILRTAISEFSQHGLSGARIDEIAAKTKTSKRMIYYYFGDKERLYAQALETAYSRVRTGEGKLESEGVPADEALRQLVGFTFDHHRKNPDFIRMVMIENIHHAEYLAQSDMIREVNLAAIDRLSGIIQRGEAEGLFRPGLDATELHWQISALSFFNVSNKPTFSALFGNDLYSRSGQEALRDHAVEMILRYVAK